MARRRRQSGDAGGAAGRVYDAKLHLLDRQVVDVNGRLVCKVDDLELTEGDDGYFYVTGILVGPGALGPHVGGWLGRLMVAVQRRLHPTERLDAEPEPPRIDAGVIGEIGSSVRIGIPVEQTGVRSLEDWVRENIIDRIPGAAHAP